jgi:hypothetical protein
VDALRGLMGSALGALPSCPVGTTPIAAAPGLCLTTGNTVVDVFGTPLPACTGGFVYAGVCINLNVMLNCSQAPAWFPGMPPNIIDHTGSCVSSCHPTTGALWTGSVCIQARGAPGPGQPGFFDGERILQETGDFTPVPAELRALTAQFGTAKLALPNQGSSGGFLVDQSTMTDLYVPAVLSMGNRPPNAIEQMHITSKSQADPRGTSGRYIAYEFNYEGHHYAAWYLPANRFTYDAVHNAPQLFGAWEPGNLFIAETCNSLGCSIINSFEQIGQAWLGLLAGVACSVVGKLAGAGVALYLTKQPAAALVLHQTMTGLCGGGGYVPPSANAPSWVWLAGAGAAAVVAASVGVIAAKRRKT